MTNNSNKQFVMFGAIAIALAIGGLVLTIAPHEIFAQETTNSVLSQIPCGCKFPSSMAL